MTAYGPWQDDSLPTWLQAARVDGDQAGAGVAWSDEYQDITNPGNSVVAQQAWGGAGTIFGSSIGAAATVMSVQGGGLADFQVGWVTITRPDDLTCNSGILPPTVATGGAFLDPNVTGVEWEPSTTVIDQQVTLQLGTPAHSGYVATSPVRFVLGAYSPSGVYGAGFMSPAQLRSRGQVAMIDAPGETFTTFTLPATETGIALGGVDGWTWSESLDGVPEHPTGSQFYEQNFFWTTILRAAFTPRYRLIYSSAGIMPPLRQWPRTDGLGASSTRRVWPPSRSVQASNRRVGGYQ